MKKKKKKHREAADGGVDSGPLTLRTGPITASHLQPAAGFCPGSLREVSAAQKEVMLVVSTPLRNFFIFFFEFASVCRKQPFTPLFPLEDCFLICLFVFPLRPVGTAGPHLMISFRLKFHRFYLFALCSWRHVSAVTTSMCREDQNVGHTKG